MNNLEQFKIFTAIPANSMPNEYNGNVFHYTSSSGFRSILFGDRLDTSLWASRYDCLNDTSEGKVAEEILKEVSLELFEKKVIEKELYDLYCSIKPSRTLLLFLDIEGDLKSTRTECSRYICSFSKNDDSLSMWNYYSKGNRYEGFNIGFNTNALKSTLTNYFTGIKANFHIYPVIYEKAEQKDLVEKLLLSLKDFYSEENIPRIRAIISTQLNSWGLLFKKDYFKHEEEVRIIVDVSKYDWEHRVRYRENYGYIIPYIELKFEKEDVSCVNFGPLLGREQQISTQLDIMNEMLKVNGYANIQTGYSKIPIRY